MKNKEYYIRLGEAVERLEEKNCPTDPSKWSYYKSQAKKKFDVYPSAYANGWASKQYGDAGGGWKKCASEATDAQETEFHTLYKWRKRYCWFRSQTTSGVYQKIQKR